MPKNYNVAAKKATSSFQTLLFQTVILSAKSWVFTWILFEKLNLRPFDPVPIQYDITLSCQCQIFLKTIFLNFKRGERVVLDTLLIPLLI